MKKIIESISLFVDHFYNYRVDDQIAYKAIRDSLSTGQIQSKLKLIEICHSAKLKSENALFIGHWHGLLPLILYSEGFLNKGIGIEKSKTWSDFSNSLNKRWNWKSINLDIMDYTIDTSIDFVVNTSCEHMSDEWVNLVPAGCRILAQSTNYKHFEHVNTKSSLSDFTNTWPQISILHADVLDCQIYKRFTIFGFKNYTKI